MSSDKATISEVVSGMLNEARRLGFSESSLWQSWIPKTNSVEAYYRKIGLCTYSSEITDQYLQLHEQRYEAGEISYSTIQCIRQIVRRIHSYLDFLTTEKNFSPATRNNRLAAIRVFVSYASACYPEHLALESELSAIKVLKDDPFSKVDYMSENAATALLNEPDAKTKIGFYFNIFQTGLCLEPILSIYPLSLNESNAR